MPTVSTRSLADRLEVALRAPDDVGVLAAAVFAAVQREVPQAFACLATLDPVTGLISWGYKSHPLDIADGEFAAVEFGAPDVNQFAEIATRSEPVGVLSIDTAGQVAACGRMREFLGPRFGFTDELRVVFRSRGLAWGALGIYRGAGEEPFDARDARALLAVHETVAGALRRTLFAVGTPGPRGTPGPAVLIVGADDRVRDITAAGRAAIEELGGWDNDAPPTSVLAVCVRARTAPERATTRVRGRTGRWLTLRATTLDGRLGRADVVITFEETSSADMSGLALLAHGLTAREREVAALVLQGASTRAIAAALHLSSHTVQDHLKGIFAKLGVNSRRDLVARLANPA